MSFGTGRPTRPSLPCQLLPDCPLEGARAGESSGIQGTGELLHSPNKPAASPHSQPLTPRQHLLPELARLANRLVQLPRCTLVVSNNSNPLYTHLTQYQTFVVLHITVVLFSFVTFGELMADSQHCYLTSGQLESGNLQDPSRPAHVSSMSRRHVSLVTTTMMINGLKLYSSQPCGYRISVLHMLLWMKAPAEASGVAIGLLQSEGTTGGKQEADLTT